tara:strand:+ start:147 stop:380 length:234 start_codon:yes stop_codon:yes gene_type:complete
VPARKNTAKEEAEGKKIQAYRFPKKTRELVALLSEATGLTMTEVICRCVDGHAKKLPGELEKERGAAFRRLSKSLEQ